VVTRYITELVNVPANETLQTFFQHVLADETILAMPANETYTFTDRPKYFIVSMGETVPV
jgi:hypothetical protein